MHPKYGLHALRHAAASLFIEQGFSPKRVAGADGTLDDPDDLGYVRASVPVARRRLGQRWQQLQARLVG
jgi:hypothetical protein